MLPAKSFIIHVFCDGGIVNTSRINATAVNISSEVLFNYKDSYTFFLKKRELIDTTVIL